MIDVGPRSQGGRPPSLVRRFARAFLMDTTQHAEAAGPPQRADAPEAKLTFAGATEFQADLRRRVDDFFRTSGRRKRDCLQAYVKAAIFLACLVGLYGLLVFAASAWW